MNKCATCERHDFWVCKERNGAKTRPTAVCKGRAARHERRDGPTQPTGLDRDGLGTKKDRNMWRWPMLPCVRASNV